MLLITRGPRVSRRRFVQGVSAFGAASSLGLTQARATAALEPQERVELTGPEFDLTISRMPANITGSTSWSYAINSRFPAPLLRWREGDDVTIRVRNTLDETTSIHWHGIRVPNAMDGVPGLVFPGIAPGETFVYRIPVRQYGTYWYHSHSGFQEQKSLRGPLIIDRIGQTPITADREYVVMLTDWSDTDPAEIASNLKQDADYYNIHQRTLGTFAGDVAKFGPGATIRERLAWGRMRMSPTDIADVAGYAYTFLMNGQPPAMNWTGLFQPGERVRLRFINGSSMTYYDVRIPGLTMTVVQADGNDVEPVPVDQFRIAVAETYDIIVQPMADAAYTIFAEAEDRSGYARGTLAPRSGMSAPVPPLDPMPLRTMLDMGMPMMNNGAWGETGSGLVRAGPKNDTGSGMSMAMPMHPGMALPKMMTGGHPATLRGAPDKPMLSYETQTIAKMPTERLNSAGDATSHLSRRVLSYADLRALYRGSDPRSPSREIILHLTGNMQRFIWGFNGRKFSQSEPIRIALGERVRFRLINDTMMAHPIHLHGLWSELENGQGAFRPYKHTINVKPGEELTYLVTADAPGRWAYHCHLLYHFAEGGMFRTVLVA